MPLTAKERLEKQGSYEKAKILEYWQNMPYSLKVAHARTLVRDFYDNPDVPSCHISVGGLDSITLTLFIRSLGYTADEVPAISDEETVNTDTRSSARKWRQTSSCCRNLPPGRARSGTR